MRRNIALRLQYDGTAYHGWQVQKTDVTVAETLERALTKVCGEPIKVVGCGRTDAGVHAKRYCANFRTNCTIPIDRVPLAVNARLPADIAVVDAVAAPEDFNAIGSCIQKEYVYQIYNSRIRDAFLEHRVCFYPQPLDFARLAWMSLGDLVSGLVSVNDMSGPVGVVSAIAQTGQSAATTADGILNVLYLGAFIAINLAVMNMLPLPALDGGRAFLLLVNTVFTAITKKKIPSKFEGYIHAAGMILLLAFMAFITFKDIWKLVR